MPKREDLPHILRLIDDDSPVVKEKITEALAEFGTTLEYELANMSEPPNQENIKKINQLLKERDVRIKVSENLTGESGDIDPLFEIGQIIHHKRFGYRGVVVEFDATCEADAVWYWTNNTQPDTDQPWYYVLVHDSQQITYVAQTSLEPDNSDLPVKHPMVSQFFREFQDGQYIRNERPWPRR